MKQINLRVFLIISILLISVGIPSCSVYTHEDRKIVAAAEEQILRDTLFNLRSAISKYTLDEGKPPQSLDDLVSVGYIKQVPLDHITGKRDWQVVIGAPPGSPDKRGIINVRSASTDKSADGTPYNTW